MVTGRWRTVEQIAAAGGDPDAAETVYFLLQHLAANGRARSSGIDTPRIGFYFRPGKKGVS
jgi:hypothetical protein